MFFRGLAGLFSDIVRRDFRSRRLCKKFGVKLKGHAWQAEIVHSEFGRSCRLTPPVYLYNSYVGDFSYLEPYCRASDTDFGKFCSVASGCIVGPPSHPSARVSSHPAFFLREEKMDYTFLNSNVDQSAAGRTKVGNDVWIGAGAFVRRGVTIGDGAIIGAGAVVVRDVEPFAIVGGVPARLIRMRFDAVSRKGLLELRWWDRGDAWLREHAEFFGDVTKLLEVNGFPASGRSVNGPQTPSSGKHP